MIEIGLRIEMHDDADPATVIAAVNDALMSLAPVRDWGWSRGVPRHEDISALLDLLKPVAFSEGGK